MKNFLLCIFILLMSACRRPSEVDRIPQSVGKKNPKAQGHRAEPIFASKVILSREGEPVCVADLAKNPSLAPSFLTPKAASPAQEQRVEATGRICI